jgi:hypothetical protein
MLRRRGLLVVLAVAGTLGGAIGASSASGGPGGTGPVSSSRLTLFYTPPVLVRAGEPVRVPVDLVCATPDGLSCSAGLTVGVRTPGATWRTVTVRPTHQRTIDFSEPASRTSSAAGQSVAYYFRAGSGASRLSLPAAGPAAPLRFYVAPRMGRVSIPAIPFGHTRAGNEVLSLPWGSGPDKAGLQPGRESATLGPSSFDVDANGRVYLLDSEQDRLAIFSGGRLVREVPMPLTADADVAVTEKGIVYVADRSGDGVTVRRISADGAIGPPRVVGSGILGQVRTDGEAATANILPADTWLITDGQGRSASSSARPLAAGGELLRVGTERRIRLGIASAGAVSGAVELDSSQLLAEVALAESARPGEYWVVAHPWRERPTSADQFQVIHVVDGRVTASFAVADDAFADQPPMTRFRLAGRFLYQLTTSPGGARIVRFDLGRES